MPLDHLMYVDAVIRELDLRKPGFDYPLSWRTVYVGGGTPSLLKREALSKLMKNIGDYSHAIEVTIEANPEDVNHEWLSMVKDLGFTRVSMGVQSFFDDELRLLGRRHDASMAMNAIEALENSGLDFSIDLIYGLPGQTVARWNENLNRLIDYSPSHFSAYLLSIEPGTPFYREQVEEAPEEIACSMYELLCNEAAKCGYNHYEISNFATIGKEAKHNSAYWEDIPYIGLGPGAHSYNGEERCANYQDIKLYMESIKKSLLPGDTEILTATDKINDKIITALRTAKGLDIKKLRFETESNRREFIKNIGKQIESGNILTGADGRVHIAEGRWLVSDSIIAYLMI